MEDPAAVEWVRRAHETSKWTTSVCTGSMLLGAAGILQGKRATSHWAVRDYLRNFGAEPVAERVVIEGKVITAGGVSAGIDMALTLAAREAGEDEARALQLVIEYDPQPPLRLGIAGEGRTGDQAARNRSPHTRCGVTMTNRSPNAVRSLVALRRLARGLRGVGLSAAWLAGVGTAGAVVSMRTAYPRAPQARPGRGLAAGKASPGGSAGGRGGAGGQRVGHHRCVRAL